MTKICNIFLKIVRKNVKLVQKINPIVHNVKYREIEFSTHQNAPVKTDTMMKMELFKTV